MTFLLIAVESGPPYMLRCIMKETKRKNNIIRRHPFLRTIRENPDLLKRQHLACALFEHRAEIDNLAQDIKLIMNE